MPAPTKAFTAPLILKADGPEGTLVARISTFDVIDKDGDVVLPGAFPDGAAMALCSWGHKWTDLPVGRGVVSQDNEAAYFTGHFFLDTAAGLETYRTVKNLAELQEFSYGFQIADAFPGEQDGQPVRFIRKFARIFETSPVLIGAGEDTGVVTLKGHAPGDVTPPADPLDAYLAAAATLAIAVKEGREFSTANLDRMRAALVQIDEGTATIRAMIDAATPAASNSGKGRALRFAFERICARQAGVAV